VDLTMTLVRCASCATDQPPDHRFCEECGATLVSPERAPDVCEPVEVSAGRHLAGASERGLTPAHNEDAFAVLADPAGDVLVVCDGVSTSPSADRASSCAGSAARDATAGALRAGSDGREAVCAGLRAADAAVRAISGASAGGIPPLSTIVLAVRRGRRLSVGWLGDSRAYFVGPGTARRLTEDHTPFAEALSAGLTRLEALKRPDAFALTRTLGGPTAAPPDEPDIVTCDLPTAGGCLVLCTDGFWRAAPEPEEVRALIGTAAEEDALTRAQRLVRHGCNRHGRDNVTVAVLLVPPLRAGVGS
jgi:serine/threonine protein phosphatase PrpC